MSFEATACWFLRNFADRTFNFMFPAWFNRRQSGIPLRVHPSLAFHQNLIQRSIRRISLSILFSLSLYFRRCHLPSFPCVITPWIDGGSVLRVEFELGIRFSGNRDKGVLIRVVMVFRRSFREFWSRFVLDCCHGVQIKFLAIFTTISREIFPDLVWATRRTLSRLSKGTNFGSCIRVCFVIILLNPVKLRFLSPIMFSFHLFFIFFNFRSGIVL